MMISNNTSNHDNKKDQYVKSERKKHDPWIWLVISGPIIVVIAALYTVYIAFSHQDSLVVDDYYKDGQHIVLQVNRDIEAVKNHISADISIFGLPIKEVPTKLNPNQVKSKTKVPPPEIKQIMVIMHGNYDPKDQLRIKFIHPTIGQYDQQANLIRDPNNPNQYTVTLPQPLPYTNNWFVRLENTKQTWRIEKRWIVSQGNHIILKPMHTSNVAVEKTVASENASKKS